MTAVPQQPRLIDGSALDLFGEWVRDAPDAVAVECLERRLTYEELDGDANRVAQTLRGLGVGDETPVAVAGHRSIEAIVGFLGVLKAGGAYVPLDPDDPTARLAFMLEDTGARVVLAQGQFVDRMRDFDLDVLALTPGLDGFASEPATAPGPAPTPESLAYVMYTSGSTGRPKGVAIEHRGIVHRIRGAHDLMPHAGEGMLQVSELDFDAQTWEIWSSLLNGARLVIAPPGRQEPSRLGALLRECDIRVALLSPGLFHQMVEGDLRSLGNLRLLLVGGDVMSSDHARRFVEAHPDVPLVNLYGPTEVTVCCTAHTVRALVPGEPVPIGTALGFTQLRVLDGPRPVEPGGVGELLIGGACLARGYLKLPDATAERFIPDPQSTDPGARLYRSGDRVRLREDGALDFLGRIDDQVKIRGFRIEPAELEAELRAAPGVTAAVVMPREDVPGHRRLVGYMVLAPESSPGDGPAVDLVRAHLEARLPPHMMPSAFVVLDELPLTPRGKIDRKALPAPADVSRGRSDVVPATDTEKVVATIWCDVLQLDDVRMDDDFLELGGDSLLALRVLVRTRQQLGADLPIGAVFEEGTIRRFARRVDQLVEADTGLTYPAIPRVGPRERVPVSAMQAQALFAGESAPDAVPYQFQALLHFTGSLDVAALEQALGDLIARHEILRTRFLKRRGTWLQSVEPPFAVRLPMVDLRGHVDPDAELERFAAEQARTHIAPDRLPLLRWTLVRLDADRWVLVHVEHHVVHDGASWAVFLRELVESYRRATTSDPVPLPEPAVQFRDFSQWQRELTDGEVGRAQLAYWTTQLAELPAPLELPTDRPRPAMPTYRGDRLALRLPPDLVERLRAAGRRNGATLFMTMLAAFAVLLERYSGQHDIVVGSGVANRRLDAFDDLIGMVLNTVALRVDLSDDPDLSELLERVRRVTLDAFAHQDLPFEQVVEALQPERHAGSLPVYQVLFSFQDPLFEELKLPEVELVADDTLGNGSAKADVNVVVVAPRSHDGGGAHEVTVLWEYSTDLFDRRTAERMLDSYRALLDAIGATPVVPVSELPIMSASTRQAILDAAGRRVPYERDESIVEVFEARAREAPEAVAVRFGDAGSITYGALNRRANQLAHHLRGIGVDGGSPVGIMVDRSPRTIETLLAILKAGGAYLPLDPAWPDARLRGLLDDAHPEVVCTEWRLSSRLPSGAHREVCVDELDLDELPADDLHIPVAPGALAYVMYTSGSTGVPKGVEVPHRAVIRLVRGVDYVELGPAETLLALAPLTFDASTFEIWGALLNGAQLALAPPGPQSPTDVDELVRRFGVTTLWLTAGLFHQFVDRAGRDLGPLRQLLAGGDVLSPVHVATALRLLPANGVLVNGYGPTEATTFTCCHRMVAGKYDASGAVPIGVPIANTTVYVLDPRGALVPPGVVGELYVGGDGVALGYLGRPELTAERFVDDPYSTEPDARLYRTGDLVRRRADGVVEFVGRTDTQVKIRGFRVEPEAVEHAIDSAPSVAEAVVVARSYGPDDKRLVAYVVPAGEPFDLDAVRAHVAARLPVYEQPAAWVPLAALPLTGNGKVDRDALPPPEVDRSAVAVMAPRDPDRLERRMIEIWQRVLGVHPVALDDDFFELGGHSLLAVDLFAHIERDIGPRLPLATIFEAPTVGQLVDVVRRSGWEAPWDSLVTLNANGSNPPFFCAAAGDGNTVGYGALARHLGADQPFYGLQPRGLDGRGLLQTRVERMARHYLRSVRSVQPTGPYLLGGRCLGGLVAFEMACMLESEGEHVALLAILDSLGPSWVTRRLPGGLPFDEVMNLALVRARSEGIDFGDIFEPAGERAFLEWLREPVASWNGARANRYLLEAYLNRPDVATAYPNLEGEAVERLVDWGWVSGRREMGMSEALLPAPTPAAAALRSPRESRVVGARSRAARRLVDWVDVLTRGRIRRFAPRRLERLQEISSSAASRYRAGPYGGRITLIRTEEFHDNVEIARWHGVQSGGVDICQVVGSHRSMLREPDVASLAAGLQDCIDAALSPDGPTGGMAPATVEDPPA